MAEVYPFIGTRYNSQLIGSLAKVISPPHDAISAALQKELHERHENNVVRLEASLDAGDDDNITDKYSRAANTLGTWRSDGIFIEDERPSFYLYEQVFKIDGKEKRRAGFLAKVKLEEKSIVDVNAGSITGSRADRLDLLRATKANISPVTAIFQDSHGEVTETLQSRMKERPWEELTDEAGVVHRLWVVQKKDILLKLIEAMKSKRIFVAEGHQRYVMAQAYRDEMRSETGKGDGKQPFDFAMMLLIPAEQDSLRVEPLHRALTKSIMADVDLKDALAELEDHFTVHKDKVNLAGGEEEAERLRNQLGKLGKDRTAIALVHASGAAFFLVMNEDVELADLYDGTDIPECVGSLDVCILHNYVINQVMVGNPEYELEDDECLYVASGAALLELLKAKKAVCGFMMNPVPMNQMLNIACNGALVPVDSGVLDPRPATGLVLRNMQTDIVKQPRK